MALIWLDDFTADRESISYSRRYGTAIGLPSTLPDVDGRHSGKSIRGQQNDDYTLRPTIPSGRITDSRCLVGFWFRADQPINGGFLFQCRMESGRQWSLEIADWDAGSGHYKVGLRGAGSGYVATSGNIGAGKWIFVEASVVCSSQETVGEYELRINSRQIGYGFANMAGTGLLGWDQFSLHLQVQDDPAAYVDVDTLHVLDGASTGPNSLLGQGARIEHLYPIGEGKADGWDVTGSPSNYEAVDDSQDNGSYDDDSSYISTTDDTVLDLYAIADMLQVDDEILGVELETDARKEAGDAELRLVLERDGGAEVVYTFTVDSAGYERQGIILQDDPLKDPPGQPGRFSPERLDATQIGFGDPTAHTGDVGQQNAIFIFLDDPTLDALRIYDAVCPYREDWTSGAGKTDTTGDDPFTSGLYVQTPMLDYLASQGLTFLNAHANPTCSPSRACVLTGHYSFRHGCGSIVRNDTGTPGTWVEFGDVGTVVDVPMATYLKADGIRAIHAGKWHMALPAGEDTEPPSGYSGAGWTHLTAVGDWDDWHTGPFRNPNQTPVPRTEAQGTYYEWIINRDGVTEDYLDLLGEGHTNASVEPNYITSIQFDEAAALVASAPEPFCLHLWTTAVHGPFNQAPPALVRSSLYSDFAWPGNLWSNAQGILEAFDRKLQDIWEDMPSSIRKRTNWIIMGDNGSDGAVMGALGAQFDMGPTYDALIAGKRFKREVYRRGTQTPLVISGPAVVDPGRTTEAMVHVVDIFPTIFEMLGRVAPVTDGVSLMPLVRNEVDEVGHARDWIYVEAFAPNAPAHPSSNFPDDWDEGHGAYSIGDDVWVPWAHYECSTAHTAAADKEPGTSGGDAYWTFVKSLRLDLGLEKRLTGHTSPADGTANGTFKLVRHTDGAGTHDELYRIRDEIGERYDPFEQNALSLVTYASQYQELLNLLDEDVLVGIPPIQKGDVKKIVVEDDETSGTVDVNMDTGDNLRVTLDDSPGSILIVQSSGGAIPVTLDEGGTLNLQLVSS